MKYSNIFKLASLFSKQAENEYDQDAQINQMESTESFEEEMGQPIVEQQAPVEEKKNSIDAMYESMLAEARSPETSLERLGQLAQMPKKDIAVPAMITFVKRVERPQTPLQNKAKYLLSTSEEFSEYPKIREHFFSNKTNNLEDTKYAESMFALWVQALNRVVGTFTGSKRKFNKLKAPVSLKNKLKPKMTKEPGQVYTSPVGEYTSSISNKDRPGNV